MSAPPELWLSAAIYRVVADPYPGPVDRHHLRTVFNDYRLTVDPVVNALVEYGALIEDDDGLHIMPYDEPIPPRDPRDGLKP